MEQSKSQRPRIVLLDGHTLNPGDLSYEPLRRFGEVEVYPASEPEQVVDRLAGASITLVNKQQLTAPMLRQLPDLRCIVVTATGYNNVDLEEAARRNIPVCNAVGYGTDSVAQHALALLLELSNQVGRHAASTRRGDWSQQPHFSYHLQPIVELAGKTLGIYGFGHIGQRVGQMAQAFGMRVLATHKHPERDARPGVAFVGLEQLFRESDAISLHAPLTDENQQIVNARLLDEMKPSAFLINTARGGLIDEEALAAALHNGTLAGAALDVLSAEPPPRDHPLLQAPRCLVTPHQAWASREARERLLRISIDNVAAFLRGEPQNVVNGV